MAYEPVTRRAVIGGLTSILVGAPALPVAAASLGTPVVAAASTLRFCLGDIASAFVAQGGGQLRLVYGSSGNLARQAAAGAPFALFLSADENYALSLVQAGSTLGDGSIYAIGRLALVARKGGVINVDAGLEGLRPGLIKGLLKRFAIANPDHAPYGMRAKEALEHAGVWRAIQSKLVLGENVAQAAQFAATGAADAGLIARAMMVAPPIASKVSMALVPARWHQALDQRMVLLRGQSASQSKTAQEFYDFLLGREARGLLKRAGFSLPKA